MHPAATARLMILADGMGGHRGGALASDRCVGAFARVFKHKPESPEGQLREGFELANREIHTAASADEKLHGMGTTGVALLFMEDGSATLGWAGDSRAYRWRRGELEQLTRDHSVIADWIRAGVITEEEAESHPRRSELTRAVGIRPAIEPEFVNLDLQPGDRFLLCSDGLSGMVRDEELGFILGNEDPDRAVRTLVARANALGGSDNITVQIAVLPDDFVPMTEAEAEQCAAVHREAEEKAAAENAAAEQEAREEAEREEKEAAEKAAREKAEREAAEKAAREKAEREAAEKAAREKARREKKEREKAAKKAAAEKAAAEKAARRAAEKKAAEEKAAAEKAAAEKAAAEKAAAEKAAAEKAAAEKAAAEKAAAEKAAAEKAAAEKAAAEKAAAEKAAAEKAAAASRAAQAKAASSVPELVYVSVPRSYSGASAIVGAVIAAILVVLGQYATKQLGEDLKHVQGTYESEKPPSNLMVVQSNQPTEPPPPAEEPEPEPEPEQNAAQVLPPPAMPPAEPDEVQVAHASPPGGAAANGASVPAAANGQLTAPLPLAELPSAEGHGLAPDLEQFVGDWLRSVATRDFDSYHALGFRESPAQFRSTHAGHESFRLEEVQVEPLRGGSEQVYLMARVSYVFEDETGRWRTEDEHRLVLRRAPDGLRFEGRWTK